MKNILIGRYNKQNNNKKFIKATKECLQILLDEDKQIFPLLKKPSIKWSFDDLIGRLHNFKIQEKDDCLELYADLVITDQFTIECIESGLLQFGIIALGKSTEPGILDLDLVQKIIGFNIIKDWNV